MIDLHTHSHRSDGTDAPSELVQKAVAAGVSVLALTDHDTTSGWQEAEATVRSLESPFTLIRGTEFSCVHANADGMKTTLHLLGYLFDPDHPTLKAERARLRESRAGRAEEMVARLSAAGYRVSWQQVVELAADGTVGRPHIAQALVDAGAVTTVQEAFVGLIAKGSPFHVTKQDLDVFTAIDLISAAGGVSVVAHVLARLRGPVLTDADITELLEQGLDGIEVDHIDHADADRAILRRFVEAYDVIATGSSDYHGDRKPNGLGCETTSPEMYARLVARASGAEPIHSPVR